MGGGLMPDARTVLITGGQGFLGRHVARTFANDGWKVTAIGHGTWSEDELKRWGISVWHSCDITLNSLVTYGGEPNVIVHCAGSGQVGFSLAHPLQDFERTVDSTAAVLEFLRTHVPHARMLFVSSAAVYGEASAGAIKENAPLAPMSPYGVHKQVAEQLCTSFAKTFGLQVIVLRLFSLYGPWLRKQLLWDASNKLTSGDARFAGTGKELRDWLQVSDAATLILTLMATNSGHRLVNGGTGAGVPVADVLSELSVALAVHKPVTFTGEGRPGNPASLVADIALARSTGWEPGYDWRKGIREYADWFRSIN
jgi:UDP-glucose 4-epimerase